MKKVIITGATSMIGHALVLECLQHNIEVYAVVRSNSANRSRLSKQPGLHIVACDLDQMAELTGLIPPGCDTFYHIAWGNTGAARNKSTKLQSDNITYTMQAVLAAHELGCQRFIGAGSQAEYGVRDVAKIGPDTPADPGTPYGISKLAAGKLAFSLCRELGMDCIWPRIFSVYGIYDKASTMIADSIQKMLRGEAVDFTAGEQQWDYLYSQDAGRAFYLIGEKGRAGATYCVGSGKTRSLSEFIRIMCAAVDPAIIPGIGNKPYPPGAVMNLCADISTLNEDVGFVPEYEFEQGIRETVMWLRRTI